MKKITWLIATILVAILARPVVAQNLNWSSLQDDQKHIANLNIGWDYGATVGVGYGYKFKMKIPVIANAQFSLPAGKNSADDFKSKLGLQARVLKSGNFSASLAAFGIFRQYQSDYVKLQNFGSEFTGVAGYYRTHWFAAAEFGFDKAIATRVKNSDVMKQYYPSIRDGWYVPTGGNFQFGIQTGGSFSGLDLYLKTGRMLDQRFKATAVIPFYFQLGVNKRF